TAGHILSRLLAGCGGGHGNGDAAATDIHRLPSGVAGTGTGGSLYGETTMIGVAIVGLGNALQPHARALLDLKDRVRVVWAAASSAARLKDVGERYGFPTTTDVA